MKYRIVQLTDGSYLAQYRVFPFWWIDAVQGPTPELAKVKALVGRLNPPRRAPVKCVIQR